MNRRELFFGAAGVLLLGAGFFLLRLQPYRPSTVISTADGCQMRVDVLEPRTGEGQGSVILLHGLSANKRVMSYLAQAFANQNLRVFVPDLPGHGRTPGPFSFPRVETCAQSFVNDLLARRVILPQRTILAGHSMGGAIALRLASRIPVAGVIAVSPAPMRPSPGIEPEMLPFHDFERLPSNSLVMSGGWEPASFQTSAANLLTNRVDETSRYRVIPRATHVSLLFDSRVAGQDAQWTARILNLEPSDAIPAHLSLYGFIVAFAGLAILAVPLLHETPANRANATERGEIPAPRPPLSLLLVAAVSLLTVAALRLGTPLRWLRLFQGDYLVSFFLIAGIILLVWHGKRLLQSFAFPPWPVLSAASAAIVLLLLFGALVDLSFYEAWLTFPRWLRLPIVAALLLPWHFAEEILLGPAHLLAWWRRWALALSFRAVAWLALTAGVFLLPSGEVLLVLLSAYFAVFFALESLAACVVRRRANSPAAAAVFGAILLAGLALAIFPVA